MMLRSAFRAVPSTRSWLSSTSSSSSPVLGAVGVGRWARYQSTGSGASTEKLSKQTESQNAKPIKEDKTPVIAKTANETVKISPAESAAQAAAPASPPQEGIPQEWELTAAEWEEKPITVDGYGDYPDVSSALPENPKYDPAQLPLPLTSPPGTLTEEQHSASLIRGRSLSEPVYHKPLYHIPVASLHLRSYNPDALDFFAHFASHAAASLGIPISKPIHLPTQRSMWTVPRSPFAHKKSQENFERKTYKRAIKAWDASPETIDLWCQYMSRHSLHGVGMKVTKWERHDLDAADMIYKEAANVRKNVFEKLRKENDKIMHTADKIIKEETKAKPTELAM